MYLISENGNIINTDAVLFYGLSEENEVISVFPNTKVCLKSFTDQSSARSYLMNNLKLILNGTEKWVDLRK